MTSNHQPQLPASNSSDWKGATLLPISCILLWGTGLCWLPQSLPNPQQATLLLANPLTQAITLGEQPAGSLLNFSAKHPPGFFNPLSGILGIGKSSSQSMHLFLSSVAYVSAFPSHTFIYHSSSLPVLPLQFPGESQ